MPSTDASGNGSGGYTDLARILGVSPNQVWMWHLRRGRNGFPEATGSKGSTLRGGRPGPVFDIGAVLDWKRGYVPSKGGHPRNGERRHERGTEMPLPDLPLTVDPQEQEQVDGNRERPQQGVYQTHRGHKYGPPPEPRGTVPNVPLRYKTEQQTQED